MNLRPATLEDAETLLAWRNDPESRQASHSTETIELDAHREWLRTTLENPDRQLFIAEENGIPVGTCRADREDESFELSWTVAPDARGTGAGTRMVAILVDRLDGPVRAEIKHWNTPSIKIAERVGMSLYAESQGTLYYSKPYNRAHTRK